MSKMFLKGKKVLITGVSSGFGKEFTKILTQKYDCFCIGVARNEEKIKDLIDELGDKKERFTYHIMDINNKEKWTELYDYINDNFGYIDVMINNAGILPRFAKFERYSEEDFFNIIKTNFCSQVYGIRKLLPLIKKSESPAIVNVASSAALCTVVGTTSYSASKAAFKAYTEVLQQDYNKEIYVALVCPGFTKTGIFINQKVQVEKSNIVYRISSSAQKSSLKIIKKINKKRKKIVVGWDAKLMEFGYKIMPVKIGLIINYFLKKSKLELFSDIYD